MEVLAHLWDELDDVAGVCRHLATAAALEVGAAAAPLIATGSTVLLAGAAAVLLAHRPLASLLA